MITFKGLGVVLNATNEKEVQSGAGVGSDQHLPIEIGCRQYQNSDESLYLS